MLTDFVSLPPRMVAKTVLVKNSAVKRDARIPMESVTAKPLMGPVPNWKRTTAAMIVVMFESRIVEKAFS